MLLADEHASMVDRLGESELEDLSLETSLKEIVDVETEHVIELHFVLGQDTNTNQATEESISFEKTLGILILQGKELTGSLTDLSQGVLDAPDLTLVLQTEFSDDFQFLRNS